MGGGGEINEMCESKHTIPSEMGGGGTKRWPLFFKKDLNPTRLIFERKIFPNDIFANFCPTLQIGGFCENFLQENLVFTAC